MRDTIGLAIVLFASTNIDDVFVLLGFLSDPRSRASHVVIGHYAGIGALVAVSVAASLASLALPPEHVGLLGLLPVLIGLWKLIEWRRHTADADAGPKTSRAGGILAVAGVTMANGGDNIAVYAPVFATRSAVEIGVMAAVFAVLAAVWIAFASWLVGHPTLGVPIRRYGHILAPVVLIGLGLMILGEAGSSVLLFGPGASR